MPKAKRKKISHNGNTATPAAKKSPKPKRKKWLKLLRVYEPKFTGGRKQTLRVSITAKKRQPEVPKSASTNVRTKPESTYRIKKAQKAIKPQRKKSLKRNRLRLQKRPLKILTSPCGLRTKSARARTTDPRAKWRKLRDSLLTTIAA